MPRVIHFELPADEPERASQFYADVFGWHFHKWDGPEDYWLITTGPEEETGINGGLMRRMAPELSTVNTIDVPSVDEYLEKVTAGGGAVKMGKHTIPGVGYFAYCTDTEGNAFGIMQSDRSAA